MKQILPLTLFLTLIFTACGDSGSSSSPVTSTITTMVIGAEYTMATGTVITRTTDPTNIDIQTDLNSSTTIATLVSGSATFVK